MSVEVDSSDSDLYVSADESLGESSKTQKNGPMEHSLSTASSLHQEAVSEGKRVEELPATSNTTEIDENRTNPASIDLATQTSLNSVVSCTSASSTCTDVQSPPSPESRQPPGAVGEPPRAAAGGGDGEEKAPVPPPRRRRKKKMLQKPPSLEHLEQPEVSPTKQRSMTAGSADLSKPLSAGKKQSNTSGGGEGGESDGRRSRKKKSRSPEVRLDSSESSDGEVRQKHRATIDPSIYHMTPQEADHMTRNSRSITPTPGISIQPDVSLELTEDMLNGQENEVVVTISDTPLARARSSNDTSKGVIIASDDESIDGDLLYAVEYTSTMAVAGQEVMGGASVMGGGSEGGDSPDGRSPSSNPSSPPHPSPPHSGAETVENQILESTMIKNLDTGEVMPLSVADERIPRGLGVSPLAEHLMRRTNELAGNDGLPHSMDEDEDSQTRKRPLLRKKLKQLTTWRWGRNRESRHGTATPPFLEASMLPHDAPLTAKYKQSSHLKGKLEFDRVRLKQDLTGQHLGAVWTMEFSICGRLLASAGQDSVVRVWVLKTAYVFFHDLQAQYQKYGVHSSGESLSEKASVASTGSSKSSEEDDPKQPFFESPLCSYYGHTADVLDLSWSKNFFLLSSSMDKTVRLWHISRKECLCCFQHVDFVTAIAFHPRDDRYFLSGSLDGKLRLWNIPDKRVALWNEIEGVGSHLITAANFCMNGKLAVVGTYDGRCIFYETEHLKYHTQIHVKSRHGKNKGRKISGVEPLPGEDKLLVTSNDSRVRLYNLKDHSLTCKYKGCINTSSQIKAAFSRDGQYIISGSEDNFVYIWQTHIDVSKFSSARRDRNEFYESFSAHSAPVTTAVFAPVPGITVDQGIQEVGEMMVAADYQGCIKVYVSGETL